MNLLRRLLVLVGCAAVGITLAWAMLQLPDTDMRLAGQVTAELDNSGVSHPVTAVLLNFRGYDTLLEIAVLMLALLGVLAASGDTAGTVRHLHGSPQPLLQAMARLLTPLILTTSGYLLWAGSHQPGGAFQAGAVLASGIVLLYLAGLLPLCRPGLLVRAGLCCGFFIFLAVAAMPVQTGAILQYPPAAAGNLILLIESGLTVSLGLMLAGLFLWLPDEYEEADE